LDDVVVHVEAAINPTENEEKVRRAVENTFGTLETQVKPVGSGQFLIGEATSRQALVKFRNLLQREHIRAAARTVLIRGIERTSVIFCLNKQVAFADHISFSTEPNESPLGPLLVEIKTQDPRQIVEYLTAY